MRKTSSLRCIRDLFMLALGQRQSVHASQAESSKPKGEDMASKIRRKVKINGEEKWIRANSEQEYADKIAELYQVCSVTVQSSQGCEHNFGEYVSKWFDLYSKPNIEQSTAETYRRQIDNYLIPALGTLSIEEIEPDTLQELFNSISGAKSSKMKVRLVLNMVLENAVEDGIIQHNPLKSRKIRITGNESRVTQPYSVEQMRYLVSHISAVARDEDRMYLAIQALHPLRLEEVLGLKWEDVNLDKMTITVRRAVTHPKRNAPEVKTPKTAASVRTVGLSAIAKQYLSLGNAKHFIFGGETPYSYQRVRRMCERIQRDTGFDERITPIRFRTTVLTDIYEQTHDVKAAQHAAGHTTAAMTLKHYIHGRSDCQCVADSIDKAYCSKIADVEL